jgi:hypothetical protein
MYNVFKRPMFKRGGTAQGSGIMSTVEPKQEPRIMARMGFPTMGLSQAEVNPETGMTAYEEMLSRQTGPKFAEPKSIPYISGGGFSFLSPSTPSNVEAAPKISGGISDILTSNRAPVRSIPYIPGGGFGFLTPGGAKPIPRVQGETEGTPPGDFSDLLTDIERKEAPPPPPSDNKDGIGSLLDKGKKIDSRGKIKKEVEDETKFLKELLKDEGYEKGEIALLLAESLATPGGINKKLAKARQLGSKVAQGRREEDKAIKLAAYKLAKEKEKYETRYGKGTDYIRNLKEQAAALVGRPGYENKTADQIYGDLLAGKEDKAEARINILRSPQTAGEIKNVTDRISRLQVEKKTANEKRKKQIDEEIEQQKNSIGFITGMPEFNVIYQGLKEKYGFKTGGRVMKAEGGSMEDEDIEDTEDVENKIETTPISTGAGSTVTEPVQKLSYKELRDRLPQEITDDVVNLLANSEEALQEFAYIRTQEDVNGFNVKYGVNLVIPPVQG